MLFTLHEEIDLGSHVIGVFSEKEKAERAEKMYKDWATDRRGFAPKLFIEENELDQLNLGYGESQKSFKM